MNMMPVREEDRPIAVECKGCGNKMRPARSENQEFCSRDCHAGRTLVTVWEARSVDGKQVCRFLRPSRPDDLALQHEYQRVLYRGACSGASDFLQA